MKPSKQTKSIYRIICESVAKYFVVIFILYFSFFIPCLAQDSIGIRKLTCESIGINQGLSQGFISSIVQDKQGYLWFATRDGLDKYDGYGFTIYRHDIYNVNSLADNNVSKLLVDSKGRLWIGTASNGVDLFDMKTGNFTHFPQGVGGQSQADKANSLRINNVYEMAEDDKGDIWLSSWYYPDKVDVIENGGIKNGKPYYHVENGEKIIKNKCNFNFVEYIAKNPLCRASIYSQPGGTFIFAIGSEIYEYRNGAFNKIPVFENLKGKAYYIPVTDTINHKQYFLSSYGDIYLYDAVNNRVETLLKSDTTTSEFGLYFYNASVDVAGNLWIGSYKNEFYYFNIATGTLSRIRNSLPVSIISSPNSLYIDRSGIVWVGTNGYGLMKFNPDAGKFNPCYELTGLGNSLEGFLEDKAGNILVASRANLLSPYIFSRTEKKYTGNLFTQAALKYMKTHKDVFTGDVSQDTAGDYWLSFGSGIGYYKQGDDAPHKINSRYFHMNQELFIYTRKEILAANDTMLFIIDKKTASIKKQFPIPVTSTYRGYRTISAVSEDKNSTFWFGTVDGVFLFNEATGEWKRFANKQGDTNSLSMNTVFSLCADPKQPDKYLWIGTNGGGLNRLEKATGICKHYTSKSGLPNDVIYGILSDSAGNLWLSTNKGLCCFNPVLETSKNYTEEDGLQSDEFNRYAYMKTREGELFFGGVNGLNFFRPQDIQSQKHPPTVVFTGFKLFNKGVAINGPDSVLKHPLIDGDIITLPYNKNMPEFEYAALDYTAPAFNRYKYRLIGVNQDWVNAETRREAGYNNLTPGTYTFEVMGSNSDGTWSEKPATVTIIITPPWWSTWWARTLYVILFITAILLVIYLRTRNLRLKNIELENKVNIRTEQLQESNSIKNKLFSIISHDLRSPLHAQESTIRLLNKGKLDKETEKELIKNLENSTHTTLNMLDNLLQWSFSQMKGMSLEKSNVNLDELATENISLYTDAAAQKNITLKTEIHSGIEAFADKNIVRLVMRNLLNNAIKFTEGGGVITLSTFKENGHAGFSVKDTGIGIPKEALASIFVLGNRQKMRIGTADEKSSGLGLSLCYELMQKSGGKITVESEAGEGTLCKASFPAI